MKKTITFLVILLIISQCENNNPMATYEKEGIAFYFLKDTSLTIQEAMAKGIDSLKAQSKPWLTSDDIVMYDYSTHYIYLKGDKQNFMPNLVKQHSKALLPFILKAKNQPVFLGALYTLPAAYLPPCPTIQGLIGFETDYPEDVFQLLYLPQMDTVDFLSNDIYVDALIESGIYHKGLSVTLDAVSIIENADTATVQYTFTYINSDRDNLYVLDPDLVEPEQLSCFLTGVSFLKSGISPIHPSYRGMCPMNWPRYFSPECFTKIASRDSLTRTVTIRGYPNIPSGTYRCRFSVNCGLKIELPERNRDDGRVWLGRIESREKEFTF